MNVQGNSITITVLVVDNTAVNTDPSATAQPAVPDSIVVTLYTPSGAMPIQNMAMSAVSGETGVYQYTYNSSLSDETGQWYMAFAVKKGGLANYTRPQMAFLLEPAPSMAGTFPPPAPTPSSPQFRGFTATAPSASGNLGDWYRNLSPTAGAPSGWVYTANGWVSDGIVGDTA